MFLTESYNTFDNISADPVCGMQICLEAERAWFKMEKQMIKLEHTAIVNNNMELLKEGEDGWFEKTKSWFKKMKETFLRYLDRVIDKWQEIQMRIKARFMDVSKMLSNIEANFDEIKNSQSSILENLHKANLRALEFGAKVASKGDTLVNAVKELGKDYSGDSKKRINDVLIALDKALDNDGTDSFKFASAVSGNAMLGKYSVANDLYNQNKNSVSSFQSESFTGFFNVNEFDILTEDRKSRERSRRKAEQQRRQQQQQNNASSSSNSSSSSSSNTPPFSSDGSHRNGYANNFSASGAFKNGAELRKFCEPFLNFLKNSRQKAIDTLKKCRNEGAKLIEKGISEGNARDETAVEENKQAVTVFKNIMNGFIIAINKASIQALKMFSILATKGIKSEKINKKLDKVGNRMFESAIPYNILDEF